MHQRWLEKPYTDQDRPHFGECPAHEDAPSERDQDIECECDTLHEQYKAEAEEMAFDLSREGY